MLPNRSARGARAKALTIGLAVAAVVALAGCSSPAAAPTPAKSATTPPITATVTMGSFYSLADLVSLNAVSHAASLGIDLKVTPFTTGGTGILSSVSAGSSDFGDIAMTYVMRAVSTGLPIKVLMGTGNKGIGLIAGPNVKSVKDLKGKSIGVTQASTNYLSLLSALKQAGMTPDDVKIVNIDTAALPAALLSGQVDAIQTVVETAETAIAATKAHVIYSPTGSDPVGTYNSALITTNAYAAAHPGVTDKLVKAMYESEVELQTMQKKDPAALQKRAEELLQPGGINADAVKLGLHYVNWSAPLKLSVLSTYSQDLKQYGIISTDVSAQLPPHIDFGPYAKAAGGKAKDYTG